jgi:hypothetical protein
MALVIHCPKCGRSQPAQHVHGPGEGRAKTRACFNRCSWCDALYRTIACGARERKAQRRLQRAGQLRLVP